MSSLIHPIVHFEIFFEKIKIKKINIPSQCLNGLEVLVYLNNSMPQRCLKGVSRCLKTLRARIFLPFAKSQKSQNNEIGKSKKKARHSKQLKIQSFFKDNFKPQKKSPKPNFGGTLLFANSCGHRTQ